MKDLIQFKIFLPSNIPSEASASLTYGIREISNFCRIFKFEECDKLLEDWIKLIESVIGSNNLCNFRNSETFAFWSHFLNEISIIWTERTKKLIQTILVFPIGSADAERWFSIMNHIKNDRRSRLTGKVLEDHLRVRLNANDDLEKFLSRKYAEQLL